VQHLCALSDLAGDGFSHTANCQTVIPSEVSLLSGCAFPSLFEIAEMRMRGK
jgi:hypothetical protein